jgi:hypothetical protein
MEPYNEFIQKSFLLMEAIEASKCMNEEDVNAILKSLSYQPVSKKKIVYKRFKLNGPQDLNSMPALSFALSPSEMKVVTVTSDGKETDNTAAEKDIIMSGPSKEKYVIKAAKFPKLYHGSPEAVYPDQSPRQVARYTGDKTLSFKASWGEDMILKKGDYVVNNGENFYRIAQKEYDATYNPLKKI